MSNMGRKRGFHHSEEPEKVIEKIRRFLCEP